MATLSKVTSSMEYPNAFQALPRELKIEVLKRLSILATLESYREFQFQRFNFSFVEAGHVPAHGRWK